MSSVVDAPTGLPHGSGGSEVGGSVPETCGEPGGVTPGRVRAASHGAGGPARRTGADYDARLERRSSASRVSSARIRGHDGPVARCPECPPNAAGGRPPRVRSAGRTGPPLDERRTSADRDVRPAESVTDTRARRSGPLPVSRCSVPPLGRVGAPSGVETRSTRRVVPGRYSPGGNTARSRGLLDDSRNTPRRGATGAQTGYPRRDSRRTGRRCRPLAGLTGSETLLQPEWGARPSVVPFPATDSDARSRPSRRCGRSRSSAGHSTVERPVRMRASSSRRLPGYVRPVPDFDDRSPNWTVRPRSRRRVDPPYRDPRSLDRTTGPATGSVRAVGTYDCASTDWTPLEGRSIELRPPPTAGGSNDYPGATVPSVGTSVSSNHGLSTSGVGTRDRAITGRLSPAISSRVGSYTCPGSNCAVPAYARARLSWRRVSDRELGGRVSDGPGSGPPTGRPHSRSRTATRRSTVIDPGTETIG